MIIANKIYQLRKQHGYSQEELAFRLNVSRQSVSKWESANSIPDIDKIIEMSKLFNVTTDYLLKDDKEMPITQFETKKLEDTVYKEKEIDYEKYYKETEKTLMSERETYSFLNAIIIKSKKVATGVILCMFSIIPLILLVVLSEEKGILREEIAVAIGLSVMIIFVTIAVIIFIFNSANMKKFDYLNKQNFVLDDHIKEMVKERQQAFSYKEVKFTIISIVIFILSATQFLLINIFYSEDTIAVISLSCLLLTSSVGVFILIRILTEKYAYQLLLSEGTFTKENKKYSKIEEHVGNIFWPLILLIYLTWSFLTYDWHITWVVWVAAGLLFEAIVEIVKYNNKKK